MTDIAKHAAGNQPFDPLAGVDEHGTMAAKDYDSILLASFGGPEGQDDVIPFLRNVTAGRGIPDERLEEVATHYRANGGISPINEQNRALLEALRTELAARGIDLPVYWGNRNWAPYIPQTLEQIYADGHRKMLTVATSAYSCYSSCRQYREDLGMALRSTGLEGQLEADKIRQYFNHPGFVAPFAEGLSAGLAEIRAELAAAGRADGRLHIFFATHSIPTSDAEAAGPRPVAAELQEKSGLVPGEGNGADVYSAQHLDVAEEILRLVPEAAGIEWSLVYQSRSGAPHVPWLEPDINDAIEELAAAPADEGESDGESEGEGENHGEGSDAGPLAGVLVVPLGFVSDHMEVVWDLDTEAKETAENLGLAFRRTPTPGTHPAFVSGLVDIVEERLGRREGRAAVGCFGAWNDVCAPNCCVKVMRDGTVRPTVAAFDSEVGVPTR
ncbi:ferrochelatase [Citricoccus muralis]|uniref:Coproporphyrin III ferrochelatase n=1 Tax=Citricoccus muralis TaxID=169134 RepID=A0A3D9LAX4_9MICC|nr:ferrochelatase [Citricoccus muralis]